MAQSASLDVRYSVERFFREQWTATEVAFPGAPFDSTREALFEWVAIYVMDVRGAPSRASDYAASLLLTVNVFSRKSARGASRLSQQVEALLRAAHVSIYDESEQTVLRGYIKLMDPVTKAQRESAGLFAETVDVEGIILF